MTPQTLRAICRLRGKRASDLARMAGVTRQAVSLWFKAPLGKDLDLRVSHLKKLAEGLRLPVSALLKPLPVLDDLGATRKLEAALLWDRMYPSLADFMVAIVQGEDVALARLVQVFGLYRAAKVVPRELVWKQFPEFKRHIRPVRRQQLEQVWNLRQGLITV